MLNSLALRQKWIGGIAGVVLAAALVYGIVLVARPADPYAGLTRWRETQIDDATLFTLEQRITATRAAIAAAEAAGGGVDVDLYLSLVNDAYILGDLVTAREALEAALNIDSLYAGSWNTYGNVLAAMGDAEPAGRAYLQAIELLPTSQMYMDYVRYLKKFYPERTEDVRLTLEHAIQVVGRNETFMVALGEWYWEQGDCERAEDHYKVAQTYSPANEGIAAAIAEIRATCVEKE